MIIQGTHPFMDGHLMFPIYGTLIIVIEYRSYHILYEEQQHISLWLYCIMITQTRKENQDCIDNEKEKSFL